MAVIISLIIITTTILVAAQQNAQSASYLDIDNHECWITPVDIECGTECAACVNGKCPLSHNLYLDCVIRQYEKENVHSIPSNILDAMEDEFFFNSNI